MNNMFNSLALLVLSTAFVVIHGDGSALSKEELEAGRNYVGDKEGPNWNMIKLGETSEHMKGSRNWLTSAGGLNRWPGKVVPYLIASTFSTAERTIIASGIAHIQDSSCVTFRAKTADDKDWMEFVTPKEQGCFAVTYSAGMGLHIVNLNEGCVDKPTVEHEILHVIGANHEHQRPDRDQYIKIDWSKATEQWAPQYFKDTYETVNFKACSLVGQVQATWNFDDCTSGEQIDNFNDAYDYGSVMHYPFDDVMQLKAGATLNTGVTLDMVGRSKEMTKMDIEKLNKAYSCPTATTAAPATTTAGPATTTAGPAKTTAGPAKTTAGPAKTTAGPAKTTAAPSETTTAPAGCKPCEEVLDGPLKGKYKLLDGTNNACPGNCEYEKVGDGEKYCLMPNGLYDTADLSADQCAA